MPERDVVQGEPIARRLLRLPALVAALVLGGCAKGASVTPPPPSADGAVAITTAPDAASPAAKEVVPPEEARIDPDGNDDPEDVGTGAAPASGRFEKVGTAPLALTRICDLTPFAGALYAAHANQPLGTDGATISRYAEGKFSVAFDWNRFGEPTKGGGAGQGFLRVRNIGGRLVVPDADPPYGGLGVAEWGTEGYVFLSDESGKFAPPRAPHYRIPATAAVLPRAYHVIDAIRFRGALYASTGSVPPKERAWHGASPGALHRADADGGARWVYEIDYPFPWNNDVTRLTFLVRFKDRLYAGIQAFSGGDPNDYVYFAPKPEAAVIAHEDAHPVKTTTYGGSQTLRFWVDPKSKPSRLYWLAWQRDGQFVLRATTDGDTWTPILLPDDAGKPTDVTRFRDAVVVLTERGLYKLDGDVAQTAIARIEDKKSPFEATDFFCTAPLAVFENALYADGQRGGSLYKLTE
jgi:hypothetical protein